MTGAENIARQNQKLHAGIDNVADLRDSLAVLSVDRIVDRLDVALAFLRHEVGPHARAEEQVFYPEVSRVLGVELGERMVGEHRYIGTLVDEVTDIRHRLSVGEPARSDLYAALAALVEGVRAHLHLEEEVLARLADGTLTDAQLYDLYERLEMAEFDAAVRLSSL